MAQSQTYWRLFRRRFKKWLTEGQHSPGESYHQPEKEVHQTHPWYRVMCLTGVDYFSTLGYQPGIAALAAGILSPFATLVLVLVTLFGALPMYRRVAEESPHGDGSISMLERLLGGWTAKVFVLALLGFVATGFVITITLSAADASKHIIENPFWPRGWNYQVGLTLVLIGLLGAIFLKGFREAIGVAVVLVVIYIGLSLVVVVTGLLEAFQQREVITRWVDLINQNYASPMAVIVAALLVFPKLALGLSGFETGVVVMPLVKGDPDDDPAHPKGRIRNSRKLLTTAALIMSVMLITSSLVTTWLIPPSEFWPETSVSRELRRGVSSIDIPLSGNPQDVYTYRVPNRSGSFSERISLGPRGEITLLVNVTESGDARQVTVVKPTGQASGRALAYLAHRHLGELFGTLYDLSTILILWFAGASAMAGLLNIVPRYLPRYGMAPEWARATRPLVLIYTAICFVVTLIFRASVDAQAAAYATGVLALMTSAAVAVTLSALHKRQQASVIAFGLISLVFIYTLVVNILEQPGGLQIASIFVASIVVVSFTSRVLRSTELRVKEVILDEEARRFIESIPGEIRIVAHHRETGKAYEYIEKAKRVREFTHLPAKEPILFLEVGVIDASEFSGTLRVRGLEVGDYQVLRTEAPAVANAIAAVALHIRDITGKVPHIYFQWSEGNPLQLALRFVLFGEGDIPPLTHEILRKAEPNLKRRPIVHVGG